MIAMKVIGGPFHAAMADIRRASDRAQMWAMRECGRKTGAAAKRHAPVKTGRYKKSIRSSRRFTSASGQRRLAIGPRGDVVHLYAQEVERLYSPMRQGFDDMRGQFQAIHEKALARALRKYAR